MHALGKFNCVPRRVVCAPFAAPSLIRGREEVEEKEKETEEEGVKNGDEEEF